MDDIDDIDLDFDDNLKDDLSKGEEAPTKKVVGNLFAPDDSSSDDEDDDLD